MVIEATIRTTYYGMVYIFGLLRAVHMIVIALIS